MILIILLIALALDFFLGGMERLRQFRWWTSYYYLLEKKLGHYSLWAGPLGVLGVLLVPLLLVISLQLYFDYWSWFIEAIFSLAVLIYCLAPEKLDGRLDFYITAIEVENTEDRYQLEKELIHTDIASGENIELDVIKSTFIESQRRTFGVILWFLLLGVPGVILYRLVCELKAELSEIQSGFTDSLKDLINILEWPVTRLTVLGMALAGHLMDALDGWRKTESFSLAVNDDVLIKGGLGALQYRDDMQLSDNNAAYWIEETKSLINRTLVIWLAIIAVMTLSGKLG
ncbi:MAG: hypothetical protein AAF410_05080 [Pseudomonadota bacterium]